MPRRTTAVPQRTVKDETLRQIGNRVRWLREALGHTQADWSRRLRISNPQLNKWEAGTRLPNIDALIRICDSSGASMDYLLRGVVTVEMAPPLREFLYNNHAPDLIFRVTRSGGRAPPSVVRPAMPAA